MKNIVVAGIGTGIGKTFVATILTEALEADYWKPIQAGNLDFTDTDFVKQHISNTTSYFHAEAYRLAAPMSPHAAAKREGIPIAIQKLSLPVTRNRLVIELAGGLLVPLNKRELNIDLLKKWNAPVLLVSQNYLGSINHTLLSIEILKNRGIPIVGLIFNGERNPSTEDFIVDYTGIACIAKVEQEQEINKAIIRKYVNPIKDWLKSFR